MPSIKAKTLEYLRRVPVASKYDIRDEVRAWGRHYDEQSIDRTLQHMVKDGELRSKKIEKKIYYKINK